MASLCTDFRALTGLACGFFFVDYFVLTCWFLSTPLKLVNSNT
jgi:hypothetical protein